MIFGRINPAQEDLKLINRCCVYYPEKVKLSADNFFPQKGAPHRIDS